MCYVQKLTQVSQLYPSTDQLLQEFLRDLMKNASADRHEPVNEDRLDQYTQTVV